jgi:hypothetical protein
MPACTQHDILQVTGSNTELDGLYYKYADLYLTTDRSAWTRIPEVAPASVPAGNPSISYSNSGGWGIFFGYYPYYTSVANVTCPVDLTLNIFFFNQFSGAANTALITAYTPPLSEPTFGLPADVVALMTSRHGSVANFLRLRNLGQI